MSLRAGAIAWSDNETIRRTTVGAIARRATECNGSGLMYHPFRVRIRKGRVAVVVTEFILGRFSSPGFVFLHSTSQPSSEPILNGVGGGELDETTTSVIGNDAGSTFE